MPGHYFAYAFASPLTLPQMQEKLRDATPWRWGIGDSETWGEYLIVRPFGRFSKFKIVRDETAYVLDIAYDFDDPGAEACWESQHAILVDEALPAVEAREIRKVEGYT